jgi:hypothetical protein
MRIKVWLLTMVAASVLSSTVLYAQTTYYVQSVKAKVMSGASFKSVVIAEVARGTQLTVSGRLGGWLKVRFNEQDGYVPYLLVSTHPPFEKTRLIKGEDAEININKGVRRRASSYTSAAAARGLAQDDRRRLSKNEKADYDSVDKMEAFTLSSDELNRFMEGNSL